MEILCIPEPSFLPPHCCVKKGAASIAILRLFSVKGKTLFALFNKKLSLSFVLSAKQAPNVECSAFISVKAHFSLL